MFLLQRQNHILSPIIQRELVGIPSTFRQNEKSLIFVYEQDFRKSQTLCRHQGHLSLKIVQLLHIYTRLFIRDLHWQMANLIKIKCMLFTCSFLLNCLYSLWRVQVGFPCRFLPTINLGQIYSEASFWPESRAMENQVSQQQQQLDRNYWANLPVPKGSMQCLF